ncbi:MAG: Tol-Pal system beta propeller repeat protein TolB [Rickettsiaceae bacterium]|nr:Tol-Pal system beta propeller repeat protein TolB [Rickettsiaceae bacterium]
MFFTRLMTIIIILIPLHVLGVREITINEGHIEPMPIAINRFDSTDGQLAEYSDQLVSVISKDLESSSFFKILPKGAFIETVKGVNHRPLFASWRQIKAQFLVNGKIRRKGNIIEVSYILWDTALERDIHKEILDIPAKIWRRGAHKIADTIYERITGDKGYFNTRVAYIAESYYGKAKTKRLAIMDFDGENHKFLTDGKNIALTPRFSPDSHKLMYISYKNRIPKAYIYDLRTGKESLLVEFPGISFAPKFSPDGTKALFCMSQRGATNIYEINLRSKRITALTRNNSINTSPSYSPDGKRIVFNSDRSGSRQLYVMNSDGSDVRRISYGFGIYATPIWSPKGDFIAFTKIQAGFAIGVMRPDGSSERTIATGYLVEGPTWSPSGRLVMFTKEEKRIGQRNRSSVYYVDITGNNEQKLFTHSMGASDPEWSSLLDQNRSHSFYTVR